MPQGDLFLLLPGQSLSVSVAMSDGGIQDKVIGISLYYAEGGCMTFMLHPQIIGIPGRAQMLEELLDVMLAKGDVWFATGIEIANWWKTHY